MMSKICISSTGTGSTDGLASQLLCKINAIIFAKLYGYEYVDIPFDDYLIKGNSGHRYGDYSTTLQNLIFTFPGFKKIDPLITVYDRIKVIDIREVMSSIHGLGEIREYINNQILLFSSEFDIFVLNGFSNLFSDKTYLYNKISRGANLVIDPIFLSRRMLLSDTFKICVHIRRGDITTNEINYHRIIPVEYFNKVVDSIKNILCASEINYEISLHVEGEISGFIHEHVKFGDINPIASFFDFLSADLIVSSKSSHSTVPGILSGKLMIYPLDSWFAPLPSWISADSNGVFDQEKLMLLIKNYV